MAGRQEGDRRRQLLHELVEVHARDRLDADGRPVGRTAAHGRVLPPAPRSVSRPARAAGARVTARRVPFLTLVPGEDAADVKRAIDRVVDRGWFVLGRAVEASGDEV